MKNADVESDGRPFARSDRDSTAANQGDPLNDARHGEGPNPTWVRYQVLGMACMLAVIIYIHRVGFARALPNIGTTLRLDKEPVSYLAAVFLFAYGAFEIPWGILGDRVGARHLLPLLVLLWSLVTGCTALVLWLPVESVLPFAALLLLRGLFGFFQAGAFPVLSRVMADWMPRQERAFSQGCIWMCTRLGGMIIPLALGAMMTYFGDWQTPLWLVSGLGVLWCLAFWPWFRNRPENMANVNAAELAFIAHGRAPPAPHGAVPWGAMLRSRSVWCLCLMYGCAGFAGNFYVTLLPEYLRTLRGLSEEDTSLLSSLPFLCGAVACLASGWLSDWLIHRLGNRAWGRRINGTVGMFVAAGSWLALNQVQSTPVLAVMLCLIFFCNDMTMGPAWASCADIGERHAGTLGGAMNMIGNVFGGVASVLTGFLWAQARPDLLFMTFAGSYFLGGLCWLGVDATKTLAAAERL